MSVVIKKKHFYQLTIWYLISYNYTLRKQSANPELVDYMMTFSLFTVTKSLKKERKIYLF